MKHAKPRFEGSASLQATDLISLVTANSLESIFKDFAQSTKSRIQAEVCTLWWLDMNNNGFRLAAHAGEISTTKIAPVFLPYDFAEEMGLLSTEPSINLSRRAKPPAPGLDFAQQLSAPIHYEDRTAGFLLVGSDQQSPLWSESERTLLFAISREVAVLCSNFEERERLSRLLSCLKKFSETTTDYELYDLALKEGRSLLGCDRAVLRRVNLNDGHLDYVRGRPKASKAFSLSSGEGISGASLAQRRTHRISDVTSPEWRDVFRSLWPNLPQARSELSVPILIRKSRVRLATRIEFVDKPFGTINFESPCKAAFSALDQQCAEIIADRIAHEMDRIEFDRKLSRLRQAEQHLARQRDWDSIVDTLLSSIRDALGYEFVSLSLVDNEAGVIRCIRAIGISDADEFRKADVHRLDSSDVQAEVVRTHQTVVPPPYEAGESEIMRRFRLDHLISVLIPMPSRNEVVGIMRAGYDRTFREHVYERDVQLLKELVTFGANAMESWRRGSLDRVSHEMNAPLTSVRANLQSLRHNLRRFSDDQIEIALEDMTTDAEVLFHQVQQLEYMLGTQSTQVMRQPLHREPVLLFRDIILKTINQLKPIVRDRGLDPRKITFDPESIYRIRRLNVDKTKISQVIFNLFMNAVKYAENPDTFEIRISADYSKGNYIIKFSDWGIGIPAGLEEKIFEERFRGAMNEKNVAGSGLGLTIARELMREHGGDLVLKNRYKPTEFNLIFSGKDAKEL